MATPELANTLQTADREAEEALLGTLLIAPETLGQVAWLKPGDFQIERNLWIFQAITRLAASGAEVNLVTVDSELTAAGRGPAVGGLDRLVDLTTTCPSAEYGRFYAERMRRARRRQALAAVAQRAVQEAHAANGGDPVAKIALLTAGIDEEYPDPSTLQSDKLWTYADIDKLLGPMAWEWESWLARGFVTLIAAESGIGKSMLALRIAASYICGWPWPDGEPFTGELGRVLWCETEAGEVMNRDRMREWGIPMERVIAAGSNPLDGISLESLRDLEQIRRDAMREDVRLVIVDSLSGSHSRSEAENEVGLLVKAVAQIARDAQKPMIITHHLNKQFRTNRTTLLNVRGSTAIAQYVRLIWAIDAPDPDDPAALRLYEIKNNLSRRPPEIGLRIGAGGMSSIPVPTAPAAADNPIDQAKELLLELVTAEGVPVSEIEEAMQRLQVSMNTARRAKRELKIDTIQRNGQYFWSLRDVPEVLH